MTALRKNKGFTLMELLVVLAIVLFVTYFLGAGALYLQNMVSLDNGIRDLKSEIQLTQSSARNSFFSPRADGTKPNTFSNRQVSLGWLVTMQNNAANNGIVITKRALYFNPPSDYDLVNLRNEIFSIKQKKNLHCQGNTVYYSAAPAPGSVTSSGSPLRAMLGPTQSDILCSSGGADYVAPITKGGLVLTAPNPPNPAIHSCYDGASVNIFFSAGYGEPVIGTITNTCQVQIKSVSNFSTNYRALMIKNDTGTIYTCGTSC